MRTLVAVLALLALAPACRTRDVLVVTEPRAAYVQVDGTTVGKSPRRHVFDFGDKPAYTVTAFAPGHFRADTVVTEQSLATSELRLVLVEDPSWRLTTTTDATNAWLRVQVNPDLPADHAWQKLVDALTDRYAGLEQLDASSGYVRTAPAVRRFKGPDGDFKIRTRFVSAIASKQPLVFKLKIECERSEREGDWQSFSRPFKEDGTLLEELASRLGLGAASKPAAPATPPSPFPPVTSGTDAAPGSQAAPAFCGACGGRLAPEARFCHACGKAQ
jgi:hypothetical protein